MGTERRLKHAKMHQNDKASGMFDNILKLNIFDFLIGFVFCSCLSVAIILIQDGTATLKDWILGLLIAPFAALLYVPRFALLALFKMEFLMLGRGLLFIVFFVSTSMVFGQMRVWLLGK